MISLYITLSICSTWLATIAAAGLFIRDERSMARGASEHALAEGDSSEIDQMRDELKQWQQQVRDVRSMLVSRGIS